MPNRRAAPDYSSGLTVRRDVRKSGKTQQPQRHGDNRTRLEPVDPRIAQPQTSASPTVDVDFFAKSEDALAILIDFDNLSPPADEINISALRHDLLACIRSALNTHSGASTIDVRLYGGWMDEGLLSRRGSQVAAALPQLRLFPITSARSIIRGTLNLATSLVNDSVVLEGTYRRRKSIPRLRLSGAPLPDGCIEDQESCPARILKKFTQAHGRRCPASACTLTAGDAFVSHEQKMVDTLLSCDLIELSDSDEYAAVTLVTGDTDFVPPLILAANRGTTSLQIISPIATWSPLYAHILRDKKIAVDELENIHGH